MCILTLDVTIQISSHPHLFKDISQPIHSSGNSPPFCHLASSYPWHSIRLGKPLDPSKFNPIYSSRDLELGPRDQGALGRRNGYWLREWNSGLQVDEEIRNRVADKERWNEHVETGARDTIFQFLGSPAVFSVSAVLWYSFASYNKPPIPLSFRERISIPRNQKLPG